VKYTRIYADSEGESHMESVEVPMETVDFAPPAPPLDLSAFMDASRVGFLSGPVGWEGEWHPAPARQLMFYLKGRIEGEMSDGTRRVFGPGDVVLLEDTRGKGHRSRVVGDEPTLLAVVQLDAPGDTE
jgi:hypothetical protein